MPSVRAIAKQAGVSTATVSRVINNSTKVSEAARQKVLAAINEVNYVPATGKLACTNLAYIFTDSITLGSSYDAGILAGLSTGLEHHEKDLMILSAKTCRQPGEKFADVFRRKGVCGAIVRTTAPTQMLCRAILESGIPTVVLGDQIEGSEQMCLDIDSRSASQDAVEHLLELGHRSIGFCTNVIDDKDHEDRYAGFRDALESRGLEPDPKLVLRVPASRQGGEQLARRLAAMSERPTAMFIADPNTCIGLMNECRKIGLSVPGDLSVVGFDDSDIRFSTAPSLTAVCQDAYRLGESALSTLIEQVSSGETTRKMAPAFLKAWFEVNSSTAPLNQQ